MLLRYAAVALAGWVLIAPPMPHFNPEAGHKDTATPSLSRWTIIATFPIKRNAEPTESTRGPDASPPAIRASNSSL